MATLRKAVLATAMISAGLLSTTGIALAGTSSSDDGINAGHHHDGPTVQKGLINSSDFAPNTSLDACNNDIPVNVLGVQVPVQDNAGSVPILSKAGTGNTAANAKSCHNPIAANN